MLLKKEVRMEGFGQRVILARNKHGWTRRELAKRAGLHEQHLANVERGERHRIEAETIIKLARALGCTTDSLLGLAADEATSQPTQKRQRSRKAASVG